MSSPVPVRKGSQTPRVESVPLFTSSAADEAVQLAAYAGLTLDPWQEYVLRGALGEKSGKWSAFEVGLVVPRQNGKNALLEARELAGLFLFGEELIIHSAHEFPTAKEAFLKMMQRFKDHEFLLDQVAGYRGDPEAQISGFKLGNAEKSIELKNGNRLQYRTRTGGGGRGFTGDLIVFDEAYALTNDELAAMLPTMAAKSMAGNPQLWYTSSAGMPYSTALEGLRKRGLDGGSDRLAYYEWSAADDAANDDVDAWYQSNPGLGIRISEQYVRDELDAMTQEDNDEQFRRERLGIWAKLGGESVIPSRDWGRCRDDNAEDVVTVAFAVDVPPSRESASICMAGFYGDDLISVVVIDRREGTSWVPSRLADLAAKWKPVAVVVDARSAAGALLPDLKRAGVKTRQINAAQLGHACGQFYDLAVQTKLRHTGQEELTAAVEAARQRPLGDSAWAWSRKDVTCDISPLVGVTLALHGLQTRGHKKSGSEGRRGALVL